MNDLDERIAIEVMGWEVKEKHNIGESYYVDTDGEPLFTISHWNPTTDANDFFRMVNHVRKMHQLRFTLSQGFHENTSNRCAFEDISRKFEAETECEDKLYEAG